MSFSYHALTPASFFEAKVGVGALLVPLVPFVSLGLDPVSAAIGAPITLLIFFGVTLFVTLCPQDFNVSAIAFVALVIKGGAPAPRGGGGTVCGAVKPVAALFCTLGVT